MVSPHSLVHHIPSIGYGCQFHVSTVPLLVSMMNNVCLGHFVADNLGAAYAQLSADVRWSQRPQQRLVYPAVTPFLSCFGSERHSTCGTLENIFGEIHLQMNCSCGEGSAGHALCQMVVIIDTRHQRQLGGVQGIQCEVSKCKFVVSTVGAVHGTIDR